MDRTVKSSQIKYKNLVIFLHGVGSDEYDLMSLVPFIEYDLHDTKFIALNGIEKFDFDNHESVIGRQWFSFKNPDPKICQQLLDKNSNIILDLIKTKQDDFGFTNQNTILVGFSQGSMVALYLNFIASEPFLAIVAFSGALIEPTKLVNNTTPICLIHGEMDAILPFSEEKKTIEFLHKHNIPYETHPIRNLGHSIDRSGLKFMVNFLQNK